MSSRLLLVIQLPETNLPISPRGHGDLPVGANRQTSERMRVDPELFEDYTSELAITADFPPAGQIPDMDGLVSIHPEQISAIWREGHDSWPTNASAKALKVLALFQIRHAR